MPPASVPIASIFCDWRSWISSRSFSASAFLRAVMSIAEPDEAMHFAGRIANAASARLQPVPFAIGMPNAIFRLVMVGPSLEMIAHRGLHPGDVIGMDFERSHPRFAAS